MTRQSFIYLLFFCLMISCTGAFAQEILTAKGNDKRDSCSEYKLQVVMPSNEIDYKLQIIKPREDIDFKLMVVDPCKKPRPEAAK
jgi:hypothetical protein